MFKKSRAQVSVEMILVLAALVAVALVLVSQLQKTGVKAAEKLEAKADGIFDKIDDID